MKTLSEEVLDLCEDSTKSRITELNNIDEDILFWTTDLRKIRRDYPHLKIKTVKDLEITMKSQGYKVVTDKDITIVETPYGDYHFNKNGAHVKTTNESQTAEAKFKIDKKKAVDYEI